MAQQVGNSEKVEVWATDAEALNQQPDQSKIDLGWEESERPPADYMNWLHYTFGRKLNHVLQNGVAQWNSVTQYEAGAAVQHNGSVWIAQATNTNSTPSDANGNWERFLNLAELDERYEGFLQHNDSAIRDPEPTDDSSAGYSVRSAWINTSTGEVFRCIDATVGAAVWVKTTLTLDELGSAATKDVGTGSGQVPTNADLGGMAYEDDADYYTKAETDALLDEVNALALGVLADVQEDQAQAIMDAAAQANQLGRWLWFPAGTYYVDPTYVSGSLRGVQVPTGARWRLDPGVVFQALTNGADHYEILNLSNVEDIIIYGNGAQVRGERDTHTGSTGEWGMGVSIRGCSNVRIFDLRADNCWGDGWYIGSTAEQAYCEDIYLFRPQADNNRRQGMSWISGRRITIEEPRLTNTGGTQPEAGIDIEPNASNEYVQGRIVRPYTAGNADAGIIIHLEAMLGSTNPVDLVIDGHHDNGSFHGVLISGGHGSIDGQISILSPTWRNVQFGGLVMRDWQSTMPRVTVREPCIIDPNQANSDSTTYGAAMRIYREVGDAGSGKIGNVHVFNPLIQTTGAQLPTKALLVNDEKDVGIEKVSIIDPLEIVASEESPAWINGEVVVSDRYDVLRHDIGDSRAVSNTSYYRTHTNEGATETINMDLQDVPIGSPPVTILVTEAQSVRVRADQDNAAARLYPDGVAMLEASEVGARLTVQRQSGGFWILERIGTWA